MDKIALFLPKILESLDSIWNEIGLDQKSREEQKNEIFDSLQLKLKEFLSAAELSKENLVKKLETDMEKYRLISQQIGKIEEFNNLKNQVCNSKILEKSELVMASLQNVIEVRLNIHELFN